MDFATVASIQRSLLDNISGDGVGAAGTVIEGKQPLFSPSAEAELYLLATNFLLYVALIIITTLIAKVYFPESLDPSLRAHASVDVPEPVKVEYRRKSLSDDDEEEDEEDARLLEMAELKAQSGNNVSSPRRRSAFGVDFEFDQKTTPKLLVLKRLLFCCLMLNMTFVTWGVLQERMLTRRYPRITGEYFTYSYALVFSNRFWTLLLATALLFLLQPQRSKSVIIYEYSFPSVSNLLSSWSQYEALRYVSFPATTLFKSFKLAPVMLMGKLLGNKEYPQYDYVVALVIGGGIALFMSSTDDLHFGYDAYGEKEEHTLTGIMLLCLYLLFDSFTGQWQSKMFTRHKDLSLLEMLFATSAFSTVLSLITLVHTKELWPALDFVVRHQEIHLHFFLFSICSTIGQLVIFYTIKNFGAVVFALIMTVRVLVSIAISCVLYGHNVTSTGFLGMALVVGAVLYRIKRKSEGEKLLRWAGIDDDKAPELVNEWHEHLDM
mmetsp:Transcript_24274/g.37413  ORF Transcript_24274/g.37413 Transcript_24274/m.37413 type:complete len:492 (-) Transcript_24274:1309-2784(-)